MVAQVDPAVVDNDPDVEKIRDALDILIVRRRNKNSPVEFSFIEHEVYQTVGVKISDVATRLGFSDGVNLLRNLGYTFNDNNELVIDNVNDESCQEIYEYMDGYDKELQDRRNRFGRRKNGKRTQNPIEKPSLSHDAPAEIVDEESSGGISTPSPSIPSTPGELSNVVPWHRRRFTFRNTPQVDEVTEINGVTQDNEANGVTQENEANEVTQDDELPKIKQRRMEKALWEKK